MKKICLLPVLLVSVHLIAQSVDEIAVRQILDKQAIAWNHGDVDGFMKGYWQNDSLMFIGKNGVTYGWKGTLNNYKKNYPDTIAMGKLRFTIITMKSLSLQYIFVVGQWHLQRSIGNLDGHFTLLFRKIKGSWVIIADHSS
ncbi:MAG TPA: DUF4440 domain-containing protein [Chitinophagaceae bacterium]|nr:DUF4440 domain-containing protein [Chitinophagaceae bacterium]